MKKPALALTETIVAIGLVLLIGGVLFYYRGPINAKFRQLTDAKEVSLPTPGPLITPLVTGSPSPKSTAVASNSIANLVPTPTATPVSGNLPQSGPEDALPLVAAVPVLGGIAINRYKARQRAKKMGSQISIL